jgi:cystathionine gamma-synthase
MKIETRAVHAGRKPESGSRDVTPAIHLSTTYQKADDGSLPGGFLYSRTDNPNRAALEEALASLEEGAAALAFSSGNAATLGLLHAFAPGDHIIAGDDVFYGTAILLQSLLGNFGLKHSLVNMQDLGAVERALTPSTKVLWVETPSNPLLHITDIRGIAAIAKKAGAIVACDNTWATPLLQLPLKLGADVVMHSVTKYLSGHSDVLSGALIFPYRVRAQSRSAQQIAEFLADQPQIEAVHYPGLPSHSGHKIAMAQMSGFGGMLSIQVKGGQAEAFKLAAGMKLITHATSLGGPHSLVEHRASVEGAATRSPVNLLRLSVGLEHPDDLIEDLEEALKKL